MPALVLERPREFQVRSLAPAPAAEGEVLIQPAYVGLCGTDLHIVAGDHPRARFPLVLGHEIVAMTGEGPVVVDPVISCGTCLACRLGHAHVCEQLRLIGIDRPGGLASAVSVSPAKLHPVPDGVSLRAAALAEPLAVAVHAVSRAGPCLGARIAILGAGPIGLLTALVVRAAGARTIVLAEPAALRRELAARHGFATVPEAEKLTEALGGQRADVVFDAAAVPATARQVTRLTRPRGTVVIEGIHGHPPVLDLQAVAFAELTVVGTRVYQPADITTALELLAAGTVDVSGLVSEIVDLKDVPAALIRLGKGESLKVLARCDGGL